MMNWIKRTFLKRILPFIENNLNEIIKRLSGRALWELKFNIFKKDLKKNIHIKLKDIKKNGNTIIYLNVYYDRFHIGEIPINLGKFDIELKQ